MMRCPHGNIIASAGEILGYAGPLCPQCQRPSQDIHIHIHPKPQPDYCPRNGRGQYYDRNTMPASMEALNIIKEHMDEQRNSQ